MKTKIKEHLLDNGFGCPVHLLNVPMVKIRGEWTPKINYNKLADFLFDALAHKQSKLTGNELKFIRLKQDLTLKEFAEKSYVTHPCVLNWEKKGNKPTGMNWATEKDIRLFIIKSTSSKKEFFNLFEEFHEQASAKATKNEINLSDTPELESA